MTAFLPALRAEGIASLAFFPLLASGELLGSFMVYYEWPRALSPDEAELARAIANHVGAAIARFSALEELRRTVHLNEMFTAVLGHDLRTPLHAILMGAQALEVAPLDAGSARVVVRMRRSGERMTRMIEQLLDLTRVRLGGGLPVARGVCELTEIASETLEELKATHPERSVSLVRTGETSGSWDRDRLTQLCANLVGNALSHGDAASVPTLRIDGDDAEVVTIRVHNVGGIPPELLSTLLEPLRPTGDKPRRRGPGLGLGLFISDAIARAHGGSLSVASNVGETTVTVTLPRAQP